MKTIKLAQQAYIDQGGAPAETYYTAPATDSEGNEYKVRWEITLSEEDQEDQTDESNMCDWEGYSVTDDCGNDVTQDVEIDW